MAADHLIANIGAEHLPDLMPEILDEAARSVARESQEDLVTEFLIGAPKAEQKPAAKPAAVVVQMTPFAHNWPTHAVRSQIEAAFPGVPVIFVDSGTDVQVIHAAE